MPPKTSRSATPTRTSPRLAASPSSTPKHSPKSPTGESKQKGKNKKASPSSTSKDSLKSPTGEGKQKGKNKKGEESGYSSNSSSETFPVERQRGGEESGYSSTFSSKTFPVKSKRKGEKSGYSSTSSSETFPVERQRGTCEFSDVEEDYESTDNDKYASDERFGRKLLQNVINKISREFLIIILLIVLIVIILFLVWRSIQTTVYTTPPSDKQQASDPNYEYLSHKITSMEKKVEDIKDSVNDHSRIENVLRDTVKIDRKVDMIETKVDKYEEVENKFEKISNDITEIDKKADSINTIINNVGTLSDVLAKIDQKVDGIGSCTPTKDACPADAKLEALSGNFNSIDNKMDDIKVTVRDYSHVDDRFDELMSEIKKIKKKVEIVETTVESIGTKVDNVASNHIDGSQKTHEKESKIASEGDIQKESKIPDDGWNGIWKVKGYIAAAAAVLMGTAIYFLRRWYGKEKEVENTPNLEDSLCIISFDERSSFEHHLGMTKQITDAGNITQPLQTKRVSIKGNYIDKLKDHIPPSKVFLVYVNYNEGNIILEKDLGGIRRRTVQYLRETGALVFVIYCLERSSMDLKEYMFAQKLLGSIKNNTVLKEFWEKKRIFSIYKELSKQQLDVICQQINEFASKKGIPKENI